MPWNLKSYKGREIETQEDIIWLCAEVSSAFKNGNPTMYDEMAVCFLKDLHQQHIDEGRFGFIENRFEILDL
jgi:hypothetical protein